MEKLAEFAEACRSALSDAFSHQGVMCVCVVMQGLEQLAEVAEGHKDNLPAAVLLREKCKYCSSFLKFQRHTRALCNLHVALLQQKEVQALQ